MLSIEREKNNGEKKLRTDQFIIPPLYCPDLAQHSARRPPQFRPDLP